MASIVKRGKTFSVVYYEGTGENRRQIWESGLSYPVATARKAELEYIATHDESVIMEKFKNNPSINELMREFFQKYGEKKWVASTYSSNKGLAENYIFPFIGDKRIKEFHTKGIDDYYYYLLNKVEPVVNPGKHKRKRISIRTLYDIHKLLRCAFNQAVRWEYIDKNPFLNVTLPEYKEKKREALTPEQVYKILEYTDRPDIYDYFLIHCAVQLAFACTMRGGEIGGAQWERYDFVKQTLYIDRVIDRANKDLMSKLSKMDVMYRFPNLYPGARTAIILKQPKTDGSVRKVYTPPTVTSDLMTLKKIQEKMKMELGEDGYVDYDLIICQANGRPIMTEHLNKRFKDILAAMDDPDISPKDYVFHSLRHSGTGFKLRISKGDLKSVQGDGGWSTPDMITKRYAHIVDEDRHLLSEEMEEQFYKANKNGGDENKISDQTENINIDAVADMLKKNPELLAELIKTIQIANS